MMSVFVGIVLTVTTFVTLCVTPCVKGLAACQLHEPTVDGRLRFIEETRKVHVGYESKFTNLVCSAHNFCDISWKKDGLPVNTSNVIVLGKNGQNLKFTQLSKDDEGIYTCEASNGMETIKTTIQLYAVSSGCNAMLMPIDLQLNSCTNKSANIGGNVTFDCRFFLGLPSESRILDKGSFYKVNESVNAAAHWTEKYNSLPSSIGGTTFKMTQYSCGKPVENGKECDCQNCLSNLCMKLNIFNLSIEAFGTYILAATNNNRNARIALKVTQAPDPPIASIKAEDWHHVLTAPVACGIMLVFLILVVWKRFNKDLKLKWKDFTGKRDDSKQYDVYLSYDWNSEIDRSFAINLARRLDDQGYRVFWQIHCLPGGFADDDILECLKTSCCCVMIFSPDYLASRRNFDVIFAMDNAKYYKKEIIPIVYRDISMVTGEEHSALVKQILSLPCLRYDRIQSRPVNKVKKVWQSVFNPLFSEKSMHKELLLRMPPRHKSRSSDFAQDVTLVSAKVPSHVSSQESLEKYEVANSSQDDKHLSNGKVSANQLACVVTTISNGSKLYPDISRLANVVELNNI